MSTTNPSHYLGWYPNNFKHNILCAKLAYGTYLSRFQYKVNLFLKNEDASKTFINIFIIFINMQLNLNTIFSIFFPDKCQTMHELISTFLSKIINIV